MPTLKLPTIPMLPAKPPKYAGQKLEDRVQQLETYTDNVQTWAVSLSRTLIAWSKDLDSLFNRGSVKRLQQ